jgi:O-antigen chain-terminating methyltransferase
MTDNFYHAFEEKFRGSRELIKSRQTAYLPFIHALKARGENLKALDLGCGRGEWLELLKDWGIKAEGVDLDEAMVRICHEMGLNVRKDKALPALLAVPVASLDIVSGFHIAEHLDFQDLMSLVKNAFTALKPGGLLILETPNLENIMVATTNFYLDPTHKNPLPAQLLRFLFEYAGFSIIEELRLNGNVAKDEEQLISLNDVLSGVSPDYAIIGQAPVLRDSNQIQIIGNIKGTNGVSYAELVDRFDNQSCHIREQIAELTLGITILENRIHHLETPIRLAKRLFQLPKTFIKSFFSINRFIFRKLQSLGKK